MYLSLTFSACQCDPDGSMESSCDANGACNCKENFEGDQCKECKSGFFEHPNCFGKVRKKEGISKYVQHVLYHVFQNANVLRMEQWIVHVMIRVRVPVRTE